ncbi:MAG: hypothetical protein P1V81_02575 [Planctomycetota bacterium]|nr:hypothetical protein [Planctomycetota bacterium]
MAFLAHEDVLEGASWSVADNDLVRKPHQTEGYRGSLPVLFTLEGVELRATGFLASKAMEQRDLTALSRLIGGWKGAKELCPIGLAVEADLWSFYFMGPARAEPAIELVLGELAQDFFGQAGTVRSREDPDWSFHVERLVPSRDEQLALLVQWQLSELTQ